MCSELLGGVVHHEVEEDVCYWHACSCAKFCVVGVFCCGCSEVGLMVVFR